MVTAQCKQFLIGLPAAGKTTFLAAMWHVINSMEVEGALKLERLYSDQEHLNKIRELWSDVKHLDRTNIGSEKFVSMLLKDPNSGSATEVIFPDLSGESFTLQWKNRTMKTDHAVLAQEAVGGLLLIHPEKVIEETLICDVEGIIKSMKTEKPTDTHTLVGTDHATKVETNQGLDEMQWKPEDAPTQIQLIDLLQFIATLNKMQPIKLAVVVSAWDRITNGSSPSEWIRKRLPLLSQYLRANPDVFSSEFYGVSAQGGRLEEAEELRKKVRPSDRIRVVKDDLSESHDITAPVRWIMESLV